MTIAETIPDSQMVGVIEHSTQDPTGNASIGVSTPPDALQMLMATSAALQPKPSAAPPHPQVTALTAAIAGGLQFSFKQLTSPTPYGNTITAYKIYRNTTANNFSGATLIRTVPHDNATNQKVVQVQDLLGSNKTASYFCTAVDSTGQESSIPGSFQSASVNSGNFNPNVASPTPTTASPSISSTTYAVIPEMTVTKTFKGNSVLLGFSTSVNIPTLTGSIVFAFFKDGVQLSQDYPITYFTGNGAVAPVSAFNFNLLDTPTAASHTYDVRAKIIANSCSLNGIARSFQLVELG